MDVYVTIDCGGGCVIEAVSERARKLFAERNGEDIIQLYCAGSPEDALSKLPDEWVYLHGTSAVN